MTSISKAGLKDFFDPSRSVCGILIVFVPSRIGGFVLELDIVVHMLAAMSVIRPSIAVVAEVTRVMYFMVRGFYIVYSLFYAITNP